MSAVVGLDSSLPFVIGVDPGKSGAIAILTTDGELHELHDMPVTGKVVSSALLADILHLGRRPGSLAVVEDVHAMPGQGVSSMFSFGRSLGCVEGVLGALRIRTIYVSPAKWKGAMRLGKDKGTSRRLAIERWPAHAQDFARVKDDGRAEAALIALWAIGQGAQP